MKYILESVGLVVTGFVLLICTAVYHITVVNVKPVFMGLYNDSGIGGQANPILNSIVTFGYIACLVFMIGGVLLYLIKSHEEEHETYQYSERYPPSQGFGGFQ